MLPSSNVCTMKLKNLKPHKRNPRRISSDKLSNLKRSVKKFGDLSSFVYNLRTESLISGHQRKKTMPGDAKIVIERTYDPPTQARTIAEGYVEIDGEKFKYREVDADQQWETEALLAANKHQGEWDDGMLRTLIADNKNIDIGLAGFTLDDVQNFKLDLGFLKKEEPESDEEYVKNTPQTTEQIPTENPNDSNPFDSVDEETEPQGRQIVIIISCESDEQKKKLKELVKPIVEENGAKIF